MRYSAVRGRSRLHTFWQRMGGLTVLALLLSGCGGGDSSPSVSSTTSTNYIGDGSSGIQGMAIMVPSGPNSTGSGPVAAAIITVQPDGGGPEITRTLTNAQGHFQFNLIPGRYLLYPLADPTRHIQPTGLPQSIRIDRNTIVTVTIGYVTIGP